MSSHTEAPTIVDPWQQLAEQVSRDSTHSMSPLAIQYKKLFWQRALTENAVVFLFQCSGLLISTLLPQHSPLWFASGTAIAFVFMRGYGVLPGIWLGSFLVYWMMRVGVIAASLSASVLLLQAFLILWGSYRYIGPTIVFYRCRPFIKYVSYAALLAGCTSLLLAFICHSSFFVGKSFFQLWEEGWLADLNGILIFSSALITWDYYFPQIHLVKQQNKCVLGLTFGLLLCIVIALLCSSTLLMKGTFALLTFPLVVYASVTFRWCGAVAAVFLVGLFLSLGVYLNAPLFATPLPATQLLSLQYLLSAEVLIAMYIAITGVASLQPTGSCYL